MPGLGDYIRLERSKGFTDQQIKDYLTRYGYQQQVINEAFLQLKKDSDNIHVNKNYLWLVLVISAIIIGAVILIFFNMGNEEPSLVVKTSLDESRARFLNSDELKFTSYFYTDRECDANILYYITKSPGNNLLEEESARHLSPGGAGSFQGSLPLSSLEQGDYTLTVEVTCGKMQESSNTIFLVTDGSSQKAEDEPIEIIDDEGDVIVKQDVFDEKNNNEKNEMIFDELNINTPVDEILAIALEDMDQALFLCNDMDNQKSIDYCVKALAVDSQDETLCTRINERPVRDSCYVDIAILDRPELCQYVEDIYIKKGCELLMLSKDPEGPYANMGVDNNNSRISDTMTESNTTTFNTTMSETNSTNVVNETSTDTNSSEVMGSA